MSFYKSGFKAEIYDYVSRKIHFSVSLALTALTVSHSTTISTLPALPTPKRLTRKAHKRNGGKERAEGRKAAGSWSGDEGDFIEI